MPTVLDHSPTATKAVANSRRGDSLAKPSSKGKSEAEPNISKGSSTQHSTHSKRSSGSSSKEASSHIDWDKDGVDSQDVAAKDVSSATDHQVSKPSADESQQKPYIVLSVKLKNGKVSN